MSESRPSSGLRWRRSAALLLATSFLTGCFDDIDDSVAPGPDATPEPSEPRVLGFVEVSFDGIGTPNMSSSVLSAPSIAALEELHAERERLRDSGEDVALDPTPIPGRDGTIQFGTRTSNGTTSHQGTWYAHGTFQIRNAQADGTAYSDDRQNLTLQAISTDQNVNDTAIRELTLAGGDDPPWLVALHLVPSGRVSTVGDTLSIVKVDVFQAVPENYIAGLDTLPGVTTVFPYGFVVRNINEDTTRTLPGSPADGVFDGEVDIAYTAPSADGANIESMSITFVALDYGEDDTFITQSFEAQTDTAAAVVEQRANSLNASITQLPYTSAIVPPAPLRTTQLAGGVVPNAPGSRILCSVRTAGRPDVPADSAFLVNIDWNDLSSISPPSGSTISTTQAFELTFATAQYGLRPTNLQVIGDVTGPAFSDDPTIAFSGNGTGVITTPQGAFDSGEPVRLYAAPLCPSLSITQVSEYLVQ